MLHTWGEVAAGLQCKTCGITVTGEVLDRYLYPACKPHNHQHLITFALDRGGIAVGVCEQCETVFD